MNEYEFDFKCLIWSDEITCFAKEPVLNAVALKTRGMDSTTGTFSNFEERLNVN